MAKGSKLKQALERYKGVDHKLEHQKKLRKQAEKRNKAKKGDEEDEDAESDEEVEAGVGSKKVVQEGEDKGAAKVDKEVKRAAKEAKKDTEWETEDEDEDEHEDEEEPMFDVSRLDDSESESDSELDEDENEEEEDIALSDLESVASADKGDIIPHQRLTINNTTALLASLNRIALPLSKLPFSAHQSITSENPTEIPDIDDDLNRELALYSQSLEAVKAARQKLKAEGVQFSRPTDYFAEMVKSDEHMGKIKQKLIDEAAGKKAAADARRQRDLKKFGKAVQVAKLQERDKAKRETMERINTLKRKRQGADLENTHEEDLFDVTLDDEAPAKRDKRSGSRDGAGPNTKRQKKDQKYGFGGKKRFAKSGTAESSSDMRGFSVKKMKGKTGAAKRPGKSRRAKRT